MKMIYRGAEAELYEHEFLGLPAVIKKRLEKAYKQPQLDEALRLKRTKSEARMLERARGAVNTPHVLDLESDTIVMERVAGVTAKEKFAEGDIGAAREIGAAIRRMHDADIVHNDLTTSNILLPGPRFIDFGLSRVSPSLEDKATDLIVFKKMLASTHYTVFGEVWGQVIEGYAPSKALATKMSAIEKRVKYR